VGFGGQYHRPMAAVEITGERIVTQFEIAAADFG
jgi:hypothetical protein